MIVTEIQPAPGNQPVQPQPASFTPPPSAQIIDMLCAKLGDGYDHPEIWAAWPDILRSFPDLPGALETCIASISASHRHAPALLISHALCLAVLGRLEAALSQLELLMAGLSQSPLVQGAVFHVRRLMEPDNPRYQLKGRVCRVPFVQMDVLDGSTTLCCASFLKLSAGNLFAQDWRLVWNSPEAQAIRASMFDGTYRYCTKMTCPQIQGDMLPTAESLSSESLKWRDIVEEKKTALSEGPEVVNLAYDRTYNLKCPSCRSAAYSADTPTRDRFAVVQENNIMPMLKGAKTVFISGAGDPFASKNFRQLIERLGPEDYPDLQFQLMTNGMLLTPKEWAKFPSLHGRVRKINLSIDAAQKETHERLRLGSRWDVMLENMAFIGELRRRDLIHEYVLTFVVQRDNFREMGDFCDLAKRVGADQVYFGQITNWGSFSGTEYANRAVALKGHPEHEEFLAAMKDPRLLDPMIILGDMSGFVFSNSHLEHA